jgi:hypothetical protein
MAKKTRSTKNSGALARKTKSKRPRRSAKKMPAARMPRGRQSANGRPAKFARRKVRKSPRRSAVRRSAAIRKTVDRYFATLNDWRKHCAAQLRKIMRGVELPDPRTLLEGTGRKMRHIKLRRLKDAGLRELHELVRLAAGLNEIRGGPARRAKLFAKRK